MTRFILLLLPAAFIGPAALHAGPVEEAIVATMRLSDRSNYSWVATVDDDARNYEIVGKTSMAGFTQVRMPVPNSVRRRLGLGVTDNQVDLIFRGNVQCVLSTEDGWKTVDELPVSVDPEPILGSSPSNQGSIAGVLRGGKNVRSTPNADDDRERRGYSNLQLGLSPPHEELGVIVSSGTGLQVEGETLTGSLTDLGAQLLLVRDGQSDITPLRGAGTFTIWIRGGNVVRFQVKLEGILAVKAGAIVRQVEVRQMTSTLIKDVGTTTVEVPAEARKKLGG